MRNAAQVLGLIAGVFGMIVGFFSYGYTEFISWFGEVDGVFHQVTDMETVRLMSVLAPLLALVGGGMARTRALIGGILLLAAAGGFWHAFGFGVFTMFPIVFAGAAGVLAISAGKPDREQAHF